MHYFFRMTREKRKRRDRFIERGRRERIVRKRDESVCQPLSFFSVQG